MAGGSDGGAVVAGGSDGAETVPADEHLCPIGMSEIHYSKFGIGPEVQSVTGVEFNVT